MKLIEVRGKGSISKSPDAIEVSINIATKRVEYDKTIEAANADKSSVTYQLVKSGIANDDIKTTSFNVSKSMESQRDDSGNYKQVFVGYICEHSLQLVIDFDTILLGKVINALSKCGVAVDFNIRFTVRDNNQLTEQLLASAVNDATIRANALAKASGLALGQVENINYNWQDARPYSPTQFRMNDNVQLMSASNIQVQPQDISVVDYVTITWQLTSGSATNLDEIDNDEIKDELKYI